MTQKENLARTNSQKETVGQKKEESLDHEWRTWTGGGEEFAKGFSNQDQVKHVAMSARTYRNPSVLQEEHEGEGRQ